MDETSRSLSSSEQPVQGGLVNLIISFRSTKNTIPLLPGTTVYKVKETLVQFMNGNSKSATKSIVHSNNDVIHDMRPIDIKLLLKGKVLTENDLDLYSHLVQNSSRKIRNVKLIAMGLSRNETQSNHEEQKQILSTAPRIRDDLTEHGRRELVRRKQLGRKIMRQVAGGGRNNNNGAAGAAPSSLSSNYKFHRIEVLPMLPDKDQAQKLLQSLANDPGVLACLAKHKWSVGCLAELYPEGKVGQSPVCVMGLNTNKGQKISIRLRTDDLKGFRKLLSIKKVLYHELAHNVFSEHDGNFFQLMRQIERECTELDWTQGNGRAIGGNRSSSNRYDDDLDSDVDMDGNHSFLGGSGRLGGGYNDTERTRKFHLDANGNPLSHRELAARAALRRMTVEEEEILLNCGCGQKLSNDEVKSQSTTTLIDLNENGDEQED